MGLLVVCFDVVGGLLFGYCMFVVCLGYFDLWLGVC